MKDNIQMLLETSNTINSRTITLTRCLILALLNYFVDGLQYRELKAGLKISDGKLISNLRQLERISYIKKEEVELTNKKLDIYYLTEQGKKELNKIAFWIDIIQNVVKKND